MFGIFRDKRSIIHDPRCAVVSIGGHDEDKLASDAEIYQGFSKISVVVCDRVAGLFGSLDGEGVDVLHLLASIDSDKINGESKNVFLKELTQIKPKILIMASDNDPEALVPFFSDSAFRETNLVMTLKRKGDSFALYFKELFERMLAGRTMPDAWVTLSPQGPGQNHAVPETIFSAGCGSLLLAADR